MSKIFKLGITSNNNKKIKEVNSIDVIANKGIVGDRHFKDYNDPLNQLSIIESENIDEYNLKYQLNSIVLSIHNQTLCRNRVRNLLNPHHV